MRRRLRTLGELGICSAIGALALWACSTEPNDGPPDAGFTYSDGGGSDADAAPSDARADGLGYPLAQKCGAATSPDECSACRQKNCCESYDRFFADDAAASKFVGCYSACATLDAGFEPCVETCFKKTPSQVQLALDHFACLDQYCRHSCTDAGSPCRDCMGAHCAAERAACATNTECFLTALCVDECNGDDNCVNACYESHPAVQALLTAQTTCASKSCPQACK